MKKLGWWWVGHKVCTLRPAVITTIRQVEKNIYRIYTSIYIEVFRSVHYHIIKRLFNYTNEMHDIYSLHTFTVSPTCFGVTFAIFRENLCVLYLKPPAVTQLLSVVTAVITSWCKRYN